MNINIYYPKNAIEVSGGFGKVRLNLGRPATVEDTQVVHDLMNLGARMYADQIRKARIVVDDLVNWRKS